MTALLIAESGAIWTGSDRGSVRVWPRMAEAGVSPFMSPPAPIDLAMPDGKQGHQHELKVLLSLEEHGVPAIWTCCKAAINGEAACSCALRPLAVLTALCAAVWDPATRRHIQALPAGLQVTCVAVTPKAAGE